MVLSQSASTSASTIREMFLKTERKLTDHRNGSFYKFWRRGGTKYCTIHTHTHIYISLYTVVLNYIVFNS
jgi:hypothetical protein